MINELKRRQLEQLAAYRIKLCAHPILKYLFLEMTDCCNLNCVHCGSHSGSANHTFLDIDKVKSVLESIADKYNADDVMLCVTGGEPLLHPGLFALMEYAARLGFCWGMTSNATLIDAQTAKRLRAAGMKTVIVSLDGLPETNDWFRNRKGAFDKALAGIDNLTAESFAVQVTTVVHRKNISELDDIYNLMLNHGVRSWRIVNIEPIGRANAHGELFLNADEYAWLLSFIKRKRFAYKNNMEVTYGCSHFLPLDMERMVRDNYFICGAGILVASILASGDICACLDIERRNELTQGNINTDSFLDVWENRFDFFRRDRTPLSSAYRDCADRLICAGDSAHTWDYDRNEPILCLKQLLNGRQTKYVLKRDI